MKRFNLRLAALLPGVVLISLFLAYGSAEAQGILNRKAPEWDIEKWYNLPEGKKSLEVEEFEGKVLYLYGFQSWCPGCHKYGFPTLQKVSKHFKDDEEVAFVTVQTTFEGFHTNTPEHGQETLKEYNLDLPMGHVQGDASTPPEFMQKYRTGGTPWTVIIDQFGNVRYNDFHIKPEQAIEFIDTLKKKESQEILAALDGEDLLGQTIHSLENLRWVNSELFRLQDSKLTLFRWWTETCPHCRRSIPSLNQFSQEYSNDDLRLVSVYHPKPPREVTDQAVQEHAKEFGVGNWLAIDQDWSVLKSNWLSTGKRAATSVSILVDQNGVIRYVHPGPRLFTSSNPQDASADRSMNELKQVIDRYLKDTNS